MAATRRLAAIMFTDLAGFTRLAHADEPGALRLLQEQGRLVETVLESHRGRQVKSMGDGLLIEFPDALDAVECAVDLQHHVHEHNTRSPDHPLPLRVGIHLGDVEPSGTDILGDAVNIASRVEPLAEPGGVCLSEPVYVQVRHKVSYPLERVGQRTLRGVREPMEIYRVVLPWSGEPSAPLETEVPRLAVLPLASISPDAKDEYFADGLTEELITVLSQIRGLRVIARTSVNRYKGATKSVAQIASELGVSTVLEGSVRKAEDRLRITVQLIDARTEEHRWAQTFDRKLENVFAIQAEVAERTAGALSVELLSADRRSIQEGPTANLRAYEFYLRGIREYQRYQTLGDEAMDRRTVEYFEAAIREDPGFSAAYSYLANHLLQASGLTRPGTTVFPRARELVARAIQLRPHSSDAHTAQGNLAFQADLDWTRAEAEFQQAIALNPSNSMARFWYGLLLGTLQRYYEAKKQFQAAIELDPLWLEPRCYLARSLESAGDPEGAVAFCEQLEEGLRESLPIRFARAWGYTLLGRADDALHLLEPIASASDPVSRSVRALVRCYLGAPEEARILMADWEAGKLAFCVPVPGSPVFYSLLGEREKALALLEKNYRDGDCTLWASYEAEWFDPIREDPRFVALLQAMKLPTTVSRRSRPSGTADRSSAAVPCPSE